MQLWDQEGRYGWVSIALHWLGAAAIVTMFVTGQLFEDLPRGEERLAGLMLHIGLGVLALFILVPRIINRLINRKALKQESHTIFDRLAHVVHMVLMLAILALIVSGPLAVLSNGNPVNVLDLFQIPALLPRMETVHEIAGEVHEAAVPVLVFSVVLHVLGAVKRMVFDRDGTMRRMLVAGSVRH